MPIYLSDIAYIYDAPNPYSSYIGPNSPRIGIENKANKGNVFTLGAGTASNPGWLATVPSTDERWMTGEDITHSFFYYTGGQNVAVDYVGFCAHEGLIGRQFLINIIKDSVIVKSIAPQMILDGSPYFTVFDELECDAVLVQFASSDPFSFSIGNISIGKSVALPRNIYVGHQPLPYSRKISTQFMVSDNGSYLGQQVTKRLQTSSVSMDNIPPDYYRDIIYPNFQRPAESRPFYWAWRPSKYPQEVGYCWIPSGNVSISNQRSNGFMSMSFDIMGHVNE